MERFREGAAAGNERHLTHLKRNKFVSGVLAGHPDFDSFVLRATDEHARGQIQLQKEALDLRETIDQALASVMPQIDARRQQVVVEVPVRTGDGRWRSVTARAGAGRTSSATRAKYSEPDTCVRLSCELHGDEAEIRIADQGLGIDPAQLDSIFDVFVQADQTLARSVGGLGLGLTIARRLVELHGGAVTAHSEVWGAARTLSFASQRWLPVSCRRWSSGSRWNWTAHQAARRPRHRRQQRHA